MITPKTILNHFFHIYPKIAVLELTNKCNLKCQMCDIWQDSKKIELSLNFIQKLPSAPIFKEINYYSLSGGEPFLMKNLNQYLIEIHKIKHNAGINISTNGSLLEPMKGLLNYQSKLKKLTLFLLR